MARLAPQLAKLTRPRLHAPAARERLFRLIDERCSHSAVWIEGPPGAGKTTLAATYVEARRLPAVWYQLDSGDSDPATFFYYLRKAAAPFSRKRKLLPLLTPEYLEDLAGFGRRFFRDLLARMPVGCVLAFDNYHDVAPLSRLHEVFAAALDEVPPQANLIVISRAGPPPAFARANVSGKVGHISWEELRLSQEETRLIASSRTQVDSETVNYLFEQSHGWAAGVMLLLERLQHQGRMNGIGFAETPETMFEYFASQIFDPEPVETQALLVSIAFFPRVTVALAQAISQNPAAGVILDRWYRRRLFVDRRPGEPPAYQFHALFRMFLQNRAVIHLGAERTHAIKLEAARLLHDNDFEEEAVELYRQAEEWDVVTDLVIGAAPALIAQGRWQTLAGWIAQLPERVKDANPWIGYWLGRARMLIDPRQARKVLEGAFATFAVNRDDNGQLLSAVAVLEALYLQFDDFRAMEPWVARVAHLIETGVQPSLREDEFRANAAVMMVATYRTPSHAMLSRCVERVLALLSEPYDVNLRASVAGVLHAYANITMDEEAELAAFRSGRTLLGSPHLTPWMASFYLGCEAYTHYVHGRYDAALATMQHAEGIAREHGLDEPIRIVSLWRGLCERRAGRLDDAEATIDRLRRVRGSMSGYKNALLTFLQGMVAFDRGRKEEGLRDIVSAFHGLDASGHFNATVLAALIGANAAIECTQYETAEQLLNQVDRSITGSAAHGYSGVLALSRGWLAHRRGDRSAADRLLGQALRQAQDANTRPRYRWYQAALAELLPVALERRIEPQMARMLARDLGIAPPAGLRAEDWPWPIKVYTLGRFELWIDGTPAAFQRKAPKRALALLQALVAFGSRQVPEAKLIEALWPEEDGDAAHRAFNTTLYRLRKLMRDPATVVQNRGRLTLSAQHCWVDTDTFERGLDSAGDVATAPDRYHAALALYRGAFLGDEEGPWIVPARERLRGKFVHAVGRACSTLEEQGRCDEAIRLYLRGLEADNLVEPFYQGLMRCYGRLQRSAEITGVYRRLKQTLSISLGMRPSPASDRLYQQSISAIPQASSPS